MSQKCVAGWSPFRQDAGGSSIFYEEHNDHDYWLHQELFMKPCTKRDTVFIFTQPNTPYSIKDATKGNSHNARNKQTTLTIIIWWSLPISLDVLVYPAKKIIIIIISAKIVRMIYSWFMMRMSWMLWFGFYIIPLVYLIWSFCKISPAGKLDKLHYPTF